MKRVSGRKDIGTKIQEGKDGLQRECDAAEGEKKNVEENRNQEQHKGGKLAKLEEAVAELDKGLVKIELRSTSRTR
jgi:hypothetical protein